MKGHPYTLRWRSASGEPREQTGTIATLSDLADHIADEVRAILLSGGGEIRIETGRK